MRLIRNIPYKLRLFKMAFLAMFFSCFQVAISQSNVIDSLLKAYDKLNSDTARFNNLLDQIGYYRLGDVVKAREKVRELSLLAEKIGSKRYVARAKFHQAVQYRKEGNYDSSIVLYMQTIKLFEELNEYTQVSLCYGSLGIAYWQLKEYEPALRYFRKAHEYIKKQGNPTRILTNLNNIAGVFFDLKQLDSALVYLKECKGLAESVNDTASLADCYGNMGSVYVLMKDTVNALRCSLLGVKYALRTNYNYQLFTSYSNLANVALLQNNYKEAEKYYLLSLKIAEELGAMEGQRDNYRDLASLYEKQGDYSSAYRFLRNYIKLNDSLISEARMKQITGLEAKYQSEKKDKELLKQKAESERTTTIAYALSIGLFLVIILMVVVFRNYLNKKKYLFEIVKAKQELEIKSNELAIRNKDVTDSINYAKRIQHAVLPNEEHIYSRIPESFIYYKAKDIVSGDFFWFHELTATEYLLVCADCTGHGVPGALMTVIGSNLLNQTVIDNKIHNPSDILLELDKQIVFTLKQQTEEGISVQDGMDLTLIKVNKALELITITSAKRPVVFIRDGKITDFKGSIYSLGGMRSGNKQFDEIKLNYKAGDVLYLFTDGFPDQFGGEKGKKFSSKRLKDVFLSMHTLSVSEQKSHLSKTMQDWKGSLEQVDDILVVGIKF